MKRRKLKLIDVQIKKSNLCVKNILILQLAIIGIVCQCSHAFSIDFYENFQGVKVEMPDGSIKLYPNPKIWAYTLSPGIKWPDSYGDGTNYLKANGECQIYLSPFINKIDGRPLSVRDRFDPFEVTKEGLHITAKSLSNSQRVMYKSNKFQIFGSGILLTKFSFMYANIKVVARLSSAEGSWPAIWMLPKNGDWPPEMDIVEAMPWGNHKNQIHSGFIGKSDEKSSSFGDWYNIKSDTSSDFHTYELEWDARFTTMKFDDTVVWTKTTPASMHQEMYLIINLAVGGKWPYNELKIPAIDSLDEDRLRLGSETIVSQYPASITIKSVKILSKNSENK